MRNKLVQISKIIKVFQSDLPLGNLRNLTIMIDTTPLITVIVITYNSEKYVIDTLESVKIQTYSNLELIISDDSSQDKTVDVCNNWLSNNSQFFKNTVVLSSEYNTGIPGNCNRGVFKAKGDWIKLIAGDDLLVSNCVKDFFTFVQSNPQAEVIYSKSLGFFGDIMDAKYGTYSFPGYQTFFQSDSKKQFQMLLRRNYCDGPTIFFKKSVFEKVGGFDDRFKFEDHPFALRLTKNNYKLYFMDIYTVYYRESIVSITRSGSDKLFSKFYLEVEKFNKLEIFPHCNIWIKFLKNIEFKRLHFFEAIGLNRNNKVVKILYLITFYVNPLHWYNKYY